ncbi:hypothetical protein GcC1_111015, partial [Golovinomyces cichoracearum]
MKSLIPFGLLGVIGVCVAAPLSVQQDFRKATLKSNGLDETISNIEDRQFISLKKRQGGGGGGGRGGGSGSGGGRSGGGGSGG